MSEIVCLETKNMTPNSYGFEDLNNMCRLCLSTTSLVSIFDNRLESKENMKEIVEVTTGVKISQQDEVSHMLCNKCFHLTIRMFKFRNMSMLNDMVLKEKASNRRDMHESVRHILNQNPNLKIPQSLLKYDLSPVVSLDKILLTDVQPSKRKKTRNQKEKLMPNKEAIDVENTCKKFKPTVESEVKTNQSPSEHPSDQGCLSVTKRSIDSDSNISINKIDEPKFDQIEQGKELPLFVVKTATKSVFICEVCNKVHYHMKDLKKHRTTHMHCKLCRMKFSTMEETKEHESNCSVGKIISNPPILNLKRCDEIEEIRQKYQSAFRNFIVIEISDDEEPNSGVGDDEANRCSAPSSSKVDPIPGKSPEIIEEANVSKNDKCNNLHMMSCDNIQDLTESRPTIQSNEENCDRVSTPEKVDKLCSTEKSQNIDDPEVISTSNEKPRVIRNSRRKSMYKEIKRKLETTNNKDIPKKKVCPETKSTKSTAFEKNEVTPDLTKSDKTTNLVQSDVIGSEEANNHDATTGESSKAKKTKINAPLASPSEKCSGAIQHDTDSSKIIIRLYGMKTYVNKSKVSRNSSEAGSKPDKPNNDNSSDESSKQKSNQKNFFIPNTEELGVSEESNNEKSKDKDIIERISSPVKSVAETSRAKEHKTNQEISNNDIPVNYSHKNPFVLESNVEISDELSDKTEKKGETEVQGPHNQNSNEKCLGNKSEQRECEKLSITELSNVTKHNIHLGAEMSKVQPETNFTLDGNNKDLFPEKDAHKPGGMTNSNVNNEQINPIAGGLILAAKLNGISIPSVDTKKKQTDTRVNSEKIPLKRRKTKVETSPTCSKKLKTDNVTDNRLSLEPVIETRTIVLTMANNNETTPINTSFKPNIRFADDSLDLNDVDDDITYLRKLLKNVKKSKNHKQEASQTNLPSNSDILNLDPGSFLYELKNLRSFITFCEIPVIMSYAKTHSVKYNYERSSLKRTQEKWKDWKPEKSIVSAKNDSSIIVCSKANKEQNNEMVKTGKTTESDFDSSQILTAASTSELGSVTTTSTKENKSNVGSIPVSSYNNIKRIINQAYKPINNKTDPCQAGMNLINKDKQPDLRHQALNHINASNESSSFSTANIGNLNNMVSPKILNITNPISSRNSTVPSISYAINKTTEQQTSKPTQYYIVKNSNTNVLRSTPMLSNSVQAYSINNFLAYENGNTSKNLNFSPQISTTIPAISSYTSGISTNSVLNFGNNSISPAIVSLPNPGLTTAVTLQTLSFPVNSTCIPAFRSNDVLSTNNVGSSSVNVLSSNLVPTAITAVTSSSPVDTSNTNNILMYSHGSGSSVNAVSPNFVPTSAITAKASVGSSNTHNISMYGHSSSSSANVSSSDSMTSESPRLPPALRPIRFKKPLNPLIRVHQIEKRMVKTPCVQSDNSNVSPHSSSGEKETAEKNQIFVAPQMPSFSRVNSTLPKIRIIQKKKPDENSSETTKDSSSCDKLEQKKKDDEVSIQNEHKNLAATGTPNNYIRVRNLADLR